MLKASDPLSNVASTGSDVITISARLDAMMAQGLTLFSSGQLEKARDCYGAVLDVDANHWEALIGTAEVALQSGELDLAIELYDALITRHKMHPKLHYKRANALNRQGRWQQALDGYDNAIGLDEKYSAAYCNRGSVLGHLGRWEDALASYEKAIAINPVDSFAFYNRGSAFAELNRSEEAVVSYQHAIALNAGYIEAYINLGHVLRSLGRIEAALASYDKAIKLSSIYAEAFQGRALCLSQLQRFDEALVSHERAIELKPDYAVAHIGRGNMLKWLERLDLAIESYVKAIQLEPSHAEAFEGYGFCLFSSGLIEAAIRCYDRALELAPDRRYLVGLRRHAQMHICDWHGLAADIQRITEGLDAGSAIVQPFILSALLDSPQHQRLAAEIWVKNECPSNGVLGNISPRRRGNKIRIGYFSADFRAHPVALLTAELFEIHDRSKFEIIAFASSPDFPDPVRQRLKQAFDQFIDIYDRSDVEVANLAREMEIDIAVDLGGFTVHNRPGIFALRAAPVQVSYIGYLGTMGAPYMDYLLADETIIPLKNRQHYSEKIVYLPSYQVNDSLRRASDRVFTRAELGLPETGFVFCCFNATYKLTPATFKVWMRILRQVEFSSLYLYVDNAVSQLNLCRQAELFDIDPARIVFGTRVPLDEYLSRYQAMDLFLDTWPYNAGATASDALWAGLPVLTCEGRSFASRYAASILKAVELPELIAMTAAEYENFAIRLANAPDELKAIRLKLVKNRGTVPLFNTPLFTKNLEHAYVKIHARSQVGLFPEDVYVAL